MPTVEFFTVLPTQLVVEFFTELDPLPTALAVEFLPDGTNIIIYNDSDLTNLGQSYGLTAQNLRLLSSNTDYNGYIPVDSPTADLPIAFNTVSNGDGVYQFNLIYNPEYDDQTYPFPLAIGQTLTSIYGLNDYTAKVIVNNALLRCEIQGLLDVGMQDVLNEDYLRLRNNLITMQAEYAYQITQPTPNFNKVYQLLSWFSDPLLIQEYGQSF